MNARVIYQRLKITGGNSGIGFGIAQEFKNEGARGAIFGRTQKTLDESVEKLGSDFIAVRGDVTKMADLEKLYAQTSERFGKMDILVANAGGAIGPGTLGSVLVVDDKSYYYFIHDPFSLCLF